MKYEVGDRIQFIIRTGYYLMDRKMEEGIIIKKDFKLFSPSEYYIKLDTKEELEIIHKCDIIRTCLPTPKTKIPMPECKPPKEDKIIELYKWLKGERYGYFLEDHKTWINYGELNDKFPYKESEKRWELSRNNMIEKSIRKMKELDLIKEGEE